MKTEQNLFYLGLGDELLLLYVDSEGGEESQPGVDGCPHLGVLPVAPTRDLNDIWEFRPKPHTT
jgi:hypothetical protein